MAPKAWLPIKQRPLHFPDGAVSRADRYVSPQIQQVTGERQIRKRGSSIGQLSF